MNSGPVLSGGTQLNHFDPLLLLCSQPSPCHTYSDCFPSPPLALLRPTPIHPHTIHETLPTEPLDLSRNTVQQHSTVIKATPNLAEKNKSFLPTCNNNNLNSGWIAMKLASNTNPNANTNRMSYPREFKLLVIDYFHNNGRNKYRTCKEFQITKSMLNGWLSKAKRIRDSRPGSLKSGRSGRKPQFPDIEQQLNDMCIEKIQNGEKVGNRWIRETAKELAARSGNDQLCQFSERWLSNFKKRNGIGRTEEAMEAKSVKSESESFISDENGPDSGSGSETDPMDMEDVLELNPCEVVADLVNQPGQLPIQAFYEKFPWLCRKNTHNAPGRRGRKVQFPDVEKVLFERLVRRQQQGDRISNRWLQDQARELAIDLCPSALEEATRSSRCLFSEHWLHNFKKRYGITLKSKWTTNVASETPLTARNNVVDPVTAPEASINDVLSFQTWLLSRCYPTTTTMTPADLDLTSSNAIWATTIRSTPIINTNY